MHTPRLLLVACALVVVFAPGCRRARQKAIESKIEEATGAEKVQVSEDGKRVTLSSKGDGSSEAEIEMGESARIPADFPKAVPIYPGSKIVAAVGSTDKGKRSHIVTLAAPAAANTVYDFYKQKLPAFGKLDEIAVGGMRMLSAVDGKGTKVSVMVTSNGQNASTVQLTAS